MSKISIEEAFMQNKQIIERGKRINQKRKRNEKIKSILTKLISA